jgi:hypothetical protein
MQVMFILPLLPAYAVAASEQVLIEVGWAFRQCLNPIRRIRHAKKSGIWSGRHFAILTPLLQNKNRMLGFTGKFQ